MFELFRWDCGTEEAPLEGTEADADKKIPLLGSFDTFDDDR